MSWVVKSATINQRTNTQWTPFCGTKCNLPSIVAELKVGKIGAQTKTWKTAKKCRCRAASIPNSAMSTHQQLQTSSWKDVCGSWSCPTELYFGLCHPLWLLCWWQPWLYAQVKNPENKDMPKTDRAVIIVGITQRKRDMSTAPQPPQTTLRLPHTTPNTLLIKIPTLLNSTPPVSYLQPLNIANLSFSNNLPLIMMLLLPDDKLKIDA